MPGILRIDIKKLKEQDFNIGHKKLITWMYYIVDIHYLERPFILNTRFYNEVQAISFLNFRAKWDKHNYIIIKGVYLQKYDLKFKWGGQFLSPKTQTIGDGLTTEQRKNNRKQNRRRRNRVLLRKKFGLDIIHIKYPKECKTSLDKKRYKQRYIDSTLKGQ